MLSELASTSKTVGCDLCGKQYTERGGLRKHMKQLHLIVEDNPEFKCWECNFTDPTLINVKEHIKNAHNDKKLQWNTCIHDLTVFGNKRSFVDHMMKDHGHPSWGSDREETQRLAPVETAFDGVVRRYALRPADGEVDLMQSLSDRREQIEDIVRENVLHEPQRVQISAEVSIDKTKEGEETEYITIYTNSAYIPVDAQCWSDQEFFHAVDQMLKTIYQFASHGSGWKVHQINEINIKLVKNSPIRGSSFIELPRNLRKHKKWLLNIRNTADHKCFAYCFTAAYHDQFKQKLTSDTQAIGWKKRDDPRVFNPEFNPLAHGPVGDFKYPMSINNIPHFEQVNNVSVNIFR